MWGVMWSVGPPVCGPLCCAGWRGGSDGPLLGLCGSVRVRNLSLSWVETRLQQLGWLLVELEAKTIPRMIWGFISVWGLNE